MNFNTNNGTIIYEKRLGNLTQSPEFIKIGEYIDVIEKYPDIYQMGLDNELEKDNITEIEEEEEL